MTLGDRAIWIVAIGDCYNKEFFDEIVTDQSEWTCNRTMRFFEDWAESLRF